MYQMAALEQFRELHAELDALMNTEVIQQVRRDCDAAIHLLNSPHHSEESEIWWLAECNKRRMAIFGTLNIPVPK